MEGAPSRGLVHSLIVKSQRPLLDEIGRAVDTPVLYLKAAWADPVLYGGRGERLGEDIDILVRPAAFDAFGTALERHGFSPHVFHAAAHERYFGYKERAYMPPPGAVTVDLHRALANPGWFALDAGVCIDRATTYDSVDGPILSLCPEDQIVYAALHQASKLFQRAEIHVEDVARLVSAVPVNWESVASRAREAGVRLPLLLLLEALAARGVDVPADLLRVSGALAARRAMIDRWVGTRPRLALRAPCSRSIEYFLLRPLLSDRALALPAFALRYGRPWVFEKLTNWRVRATR